MDLFNSMKISASGMRAQSLRLRVIAENVANADSLASGPADAPYRRKLVSFANTLDRATGARMVDVRAIRPDATPFPKSYDPSHPAADGQGYVETPNVNPLIEMMDMREAHRSYQANLSVIDVSKRMLMRAIDLIAR